MKNSQILNKTPEYMYLVTGVAGFIGFHLSLELLKKKNIVIGVDNINHYYDPQIKYSRLKILRKFPKFKFFKIDLNNKKNFSKKINRYKNKIETIIHLAGQAGVRYSIINPSSYITNNIMSYIHLLEFFKDSSKNTALITFWSMRDGANFPLHHYDFVHPHQAPFISGTSVFLIQIRVKILLLILHK